MRFLRPFIKNLLRPQAYAVYTNQLFFFKGWRLVLALLIRLEVLGSI
jgi:hypothetical protein